MSDQQKGGSAYRDFRITAYRNKYESALLYGGKGWTYGQILERIEQAYNTFCQMDVRPGERVCLWLPNCPDLVCAYYALSRLGAVGALAHGQASPIEIRMQMEQTGAVRLMTTEERYARFCKSGASLGAGKIILCRPEKDMRGAALSAYRQSLRQIEAEEEKYYWDEQTAFNAYHSGDAAFQEEQAAVLLFSGSSFYTVCPVCYMPNELTAAAETFYRHQEASHRIYVEPSLAFEGGFLAMHSAFCSAREVLFGEEERMALLKKYKPDLLVGTDELFWELRQRAEEFKGKWKNLQGGIQFGKEISPLMEKYAPMAFAKLGGKGMLSSSPVPLKIWGESLYYIRDFGVRLADVEARVEALEEVEKCRCLPESGGLKLQITAKKEGSKALSARIAAFCRAEMGRIHLPKKIEYKRK